MTRRLLDGDPQRERRRQFILLDRIARKSERRLYTELNKTMRAMVAEWETTGNIKESAEHERAIYGILRGVWSESIRALGDRVLRQGKASGKILEHKQAEFNDWYELFTEDYMTIVGGDLIAADISLTTREQIMEQVNMGRREGLGQLEIAKAIRKKVPTISRYRAGVIARTESHSAANYGAHQAAKKTGLEMQREWIASNNPKRTRETHQKADGQIVGMDERFIVGNAELKFPGDPDGPAKETINCRCAVGYVVQD